MQYVRALKESGCRWFLYENNKSMHNNIKEFITKQLGVEPILINSALVSAQNRNRYYWTNIPGVCQPEDKGILLEDVIIGGGVRNTRIQKQMLDGELQWGSIMEQPGETSAHDDCRAVKVGKQGNEIKLNTGKALCLLARDYKGFGNQEMNGVIEKI